MELLIELWNQTFMKGSKISNFLFQTVFWCPEYFCFRLFRISIISTWNSPLLWSIYSISITVTKVSIIEAISIFIKIIMDYITFYVNFGIRLLFSTKVSRFSGCSIFKKETEDKTISISFMGRSDDHLICKYFFVFG